MNNFQEDSVSHKLRSLTIKQLPLILIAVFLVGMAIFLGTQKYFTLSLNKNYASETLASDFLKNDPTAQGIVSGSITNYDIKTFGLVYGYSPGDVNTFGFRVMSAIKQLGYSTYLYTVGGNSAAHLLLVKFERLNNLPVSDIVTPQILLALDAKLMTSEQVDSARGHSFPLYSHFAEAPVNEPSKDHFSRILFDAFNSLPSKLSLMNQDNFLSFFGGQFSFNFGSLPYSDPNWKYCGAGYYSGYGDHCQIISKTYDIINDFNQVETYLHEYAHYLDFNLYGGTNRVGSAAGSIKTDDFYSISYDISRGEKNSSGSIFYPLRRPVTAKSTEFVGSYAVGWSMNNNALDMLSPYEDFAESFAFYVTGGRVFRQLGVDHPYLLQKYNWLKNNVFGGVEYDTGNPANISLLKNQPRGSDGNIAFSIGDYSYSDPNFVWDYKLPILSAPTVSPTPTTLASTFSFRYLKIETPQNSSLVGWKEVEVYDNFGSRVSPLGSSASLFTKTNPPNQAYDGNTATYWASGVTAGFITIDYGKVAQSVSLIRLLPAYSLPSSAQHIVYISNDGLNFVQLNSYKGPISDGTWLEYRKN